MIYPGKTGTARVHEKNVFCCAQWRALLVYVRSTVYNITLFTYWLLRSPSSLYIDLINRKTYWEPAPSAWGWRWDTLLLLTLDWAETSALLGSLDLLTLDWTRLDQHSWFSGFEAQLGLSALSLLGLHLANCRSWDFPGSVTVCSS